LLLRELHHALEWAVITSTGGRINVELPSSPNAARVKKDALGARSGKQHP
jgi:hypothetical protein